MASDVFPGKFLLHPMDFGSCLGFTASNSIPLHKSYSHCLHEVGMQELDIRHSGIIEYMKRKTGWLLPPCLFSKVLFQLGLREAGQVPHVLNSQGVCDGDTQLAPKVTSAPVNEGIQ